jgi:hypothetical protein
MKFNKWTMGLAAIGVVSLASARADEKPSVLNTALSNTTISGYVDTAAQWNLGSQNGGATPAFAFNSGKQDGFNLNSVDIALDRPMDEAPWAAGYHVELMFGPDATPGAATGRRGAVLNTTSANIRQAYLALRTPVGNTGIDWKFGVWDSPIGYESTTDGANPNYTRSYGYTMEPTTFTGLLGNFKVNDMVSLWAGIADGSYVAAAGYAAGPTPINGRNVQESKKAYMGGITLTAPDSAGFMKGATMSVGLVNNNDGAPTMSSANYGTTSFYAGITIPTPWTALKVGAAFDYLDVHDSFSSYTQSSDNTAWCVGAYVNFQVNDKFSLNGRAEHLAVNQNSTYYTMPNLTADELTLTAQYNLWANVISRVEFRVDHLEHSQSSYSSSYYSSVSGSRGSSSSSSSLGFDNSTVGFAGTDGSTYSSQWFGIHQNAYMLAVNLIYQF